MRRPAFGAALGRWQRRPSGRLTRAQKDWLSRTGSLTRHLGTLGQVRVRVTREAVAQAWPDEAACLGLTRRAAVWLREVVLYVDGAPCVAAHSVAPLPASHGMWRAMRALRTRPLAELLYADRSVRRSPLVSCVLTSGMPLARHAQRVLRQTPPGEGPQGRRGGAPLVARRSVFTRGAAPLMVTECLLPALWQKCAPLRAGAARAQRVSPRAA